jgi:hypothetical protein
MNILKFFDFNGFFKGLKQTEIKDIKNKSFYYNLTIRSETNEPTSIPEINDT